MGELQDRPSSLDSYCLAARFDREREALQVYNRTQNLIYREPCELSAYRLQVSRIWHVAVVGVSPTEDLNRRIERILARGQAVVLPEDVVEMLVERSAQMRSQGPWTERHYRP